MSTPDVHLHFLRPLEWTPLFQDMFTLIQLRLIYTFSMQSYQTKHKIMKHEAASSLNVRLLMIRWISLLQSESLLFHFDSVCSVNNRSTACCYLEKLEEKKGNKRATIVFNFTFMSNLKSFTLSLSLTTMTLQGKRMMCSIREKA